MRIGLNLLFLLPGETGGIQTHALSLLAELAKLDRINEYFIFLNRESLALPMELPSNFHRVQCPFSAKVRLVRYAWEQVVLPAQILSLHLDVFHSMAYVGPVFASCASIVTTHDANFRVRGNGMGWFRRLVVGAISTALAHRAEIILTVSNFARQEIERKMWVSRAKIHVISNAAGDDAIAASCQSRSRCARFVAAFAGGDQNKNIPRLIEAYGRIADGVPHRLVLMGRAPTFVREAIGRLPAYVVSRIKLTDYLDRSDVLRLLGAAELFVFPSFYEGFGIPILEAQACGAPVACARATSLPEVAGDAAVYFDPDDVDDIACTIEAVLGDEELRHELQRRGYRNVKRYDWSASARRVISAYAEVSGAASIGELNRPVREGDRCVV